MTNVVSGMVINDECKQKISELKSRNHRFVVFKIDEQANQVIIDSVGAPDKSYEDLAKSFPADQCRYAVFDFDFVDEEKCPRSKICFIAWTPEVANVKTKMVYASTKDRVKREFEGIQVEIQATDASEMSFDAIKSRACSLGKN